MEILAKEYENEPVRFAPLQLVKLKEEGDAVTVPYRNMVISKVNTGCLRLSVFNEQYQWHQQPMHILDK